MARALLAGNFEDADEPAAEEWNSVAGGYYDLKHATADQAGITTEADLTDLAGLTVTFPTNRKIKVTAHCTVDSTVNDDHAILALYYDGDQKATCRRQVGMSGRDETFSITWAPAGALAAGAHTFKLTLRRSSGTGTVALRASSSDQAVLIVEDIGAVT